jgi:UDP-glucose 4-epimerase
MVWSICGDYFEAQMKVAITGSTGLIGSAVHDRVSKISDAVTLGRSAHSDQNVDLSDPASIRRLDLAGCDALIHCAGIVDEDFADPGRAFRQATEGMAALVTHAKAAKVSRFAYISSAHVYGPLSGVIDENSPPNPLHDYAIAHFASEQVLRRATSSGLRALVVRPCAVFGIPKELARFRRWSLIPFDFPRSAIQKGVIALATHGRQSRNFVGTPDIAEVVMKWLQCNDDSAPVFLASNPIGNRTMTILAFAELCAELSTTITGRPCAVTRPDVQAGRVEEFAYNSIHPWARGQTDLVESLEELMRVLAESSPKSERSDPA